MVISILGGGSRATALASLLAEKNQVLLYMRNPEDCKYLNKNHKNKKYLSSYSLSPNIRATSDLEEVFLNDLVINAIPTQAVRSVIKEACPYVRKDTIIVNVSKGLEVGTGLRISQIIKDEVGYISYAVLSGPSHAEEVIEKMPTAIVVASKDPALAEKIQDLFLRSYFRVYTSSDLVGVELGGAIKNILAFGIGLAEGLGFGDNCKAALMTRGVHEMNRFAVFFGADPRTINGLSGIGDLIVTATSKHSRNHMAGILFGQGLSLEEVQSQVNMVVESLPTTKSVYALSEKYQIDLPITREIYRVVYEGADPEKSVIKLMDRQRKSEY